jgi:hypothetical protein
MTTKFKIALSVTGLTLALTLVFASPALIRATLAVPKLTARNSIA